MLLTLLGKGGISLCCGGQIVVVESRDHGSLVLLMLPDIRGAFGSLLLLQDLNLVLDITRLYKELFTLNDLSRLLFAAEVLLLGWAGYGGLCLDLIDGY
jgi:hypothetical protein